MTRRCFGLIAGMVLLLVQTGCAVLQFDNTYYSPRNRERTVRRTTSLIILHTTEAPASSALRKLRDLGECHYCITENGRVYRIIDHRREAYHAGRSMWNGRSNVDSFSVGIEVCGYHNKSPTKAQYQAIADLVGELKSIYRIPDQNVLAHSHVAYGTPNKWHRRSHRGRKRCGMLFALPAVRKRLNLKTRPAFDPDVRAKRLVVGDAYLNQVLYGKNVTGLTGVPTAAITFPKEDNVIAVGRSAWDIARDAYADASTTYIFPNGSKKRGDEIADFKLIPAGTKVVVNAATAADNRPDNYQVISFKCQATDIAGDEILLPTTLYIYPNGHFKTGNQLNAESILKLPYGTKVLVGYLVGGPITASRPASLFCGNRWRAKDTFFLYYGQLVPGNKVDDSKIPAGAYVFFKS
ncbi:MAG: N-acetylmuramoyl-L-alanine amidase [Kiritimatiellae bacterium]|nr:N-acetylmuramoyl-L-alanine amidase [Kiritimatiellia bacterium]